MAYSDTFFIKILIIILLSIPLSVFADKVNHHQALKCLSMAKKKLDDPKIGTMNVITFSGLSKNVSTGNAYRRFNMHRGLTVAEDGNHTFLDQISPKNNMTRHILTSEGEFICSIPYNVKISAKDSIQRDMMDLKNADISDLKTKGVIYIYENVATGFRGYRKKYATIKCKNSARAGGALGKEYNDLIKAYLKAIDIISQQFGQTGGGVNNAPDRVATRLEYPLHCALISEHYQREHNVAIIDAARAWDARNGGATATEFQPVQVIKGE